MTASQSTADTLQEIHAQFETAFTPGAMSSEQAQPADIIVEAAPGGIYNFSALGRIE